MIFNFQYFSDTTYINAWQPVSTPGLTLSDEEKDKAIRYEYFGIFLFRNFQDMFKKDETTIDDYIPVSEIIKTNKKWWTECKAKFTWDAGFSTFVDNLTA